MLRTLVTGANGFVGKALINELVKRNIIYSGAVRDRNKCFNNSFIEVGDIDEQTNWSCALKDVDVVIHLAARVHMINEKAPNPLGAFNSMNVEGTRNLAQQAAKANVKRFVFISSVKVNGESTSKKAFNELDAPNPQDPYAISKWEAEKTLRKIEKETGMEVVILRPPLVYGAGVKANFASLLKFVNQKFPFPLANIRTKRSLIYVGNLVDAIITSALHPKAAGQTYLVSDGEDLSMSQLINRIAFALNKPSYLWSFPVSGMRFLARLIGKLSSIDRLTQSLVINSSRIRQELDWIPPYNMDEGLKITADWYLKSLMCKNS